MAGLARSANIRRQMAGDVARFLPPGHSSRENSIGQFSMPMVTFHVSANCTSGRQTSRKRGQLSSTERVQSRPMNVFTRRTSSRAAARMTDSKCCRVACLSSSWGESRFG